MEARKKNKTNSACICTHKASGAQGYAEDHREQSRNKQLAFLRMIETPKFKLWHKLEVSRKIGDEKKIEEYIDKQLKPKNLKVEVKDEEGLWKEVGYNEIVMEEDCG